MEKLNFGKLMGAAWMVLALAGPLCAGDQAGDLPTVQEQLRAMRQTIQRQQEQIDRLKHEVGSVGNSRDALQAQREHVVAMIKQETAAMKQDLGWVANWKLSGDFRYRHEWRNEGDRADDARDRNRHRIRFRLGLKARVNDEWAFGARMVTGNDDPVSTNQTLDGWFTTKNFMLDRAYVTYEPKATKALKLTAGKMGVPFYKAGGKSDLIFDGDLAPEGIAANYETPLADNLTLYLSGGGFYLDRDVVRTADQSLWGAQGYLKSGLPQLGEGVYLLAGCSYYDYANVESMPGYDFDGDGNADFFGNSNDGTNFLADYNIVNPFVEFGFPIANLPFTVFGDFAINAGADDNPAFSENDFGWLVGCKLGKAKKPGTWEVKYDYREVQPDSVMGAFTDSDSFGGGTNGTGHRVGVTYAVAEHASLGATYFCQEEGSFTHGGEKPFYHRLQVDMKLKF